MVRSIVGTLVDVGLGKASPGDVRGILVARDRGAAGQVAPPHGLVLWEVGYPCATRGRTIDRTVTTIRHARPARVVEPDEIVEQLRAAGHSVGRTRSAVVEAVRRQDGAFTADELAAAVPAVHVSTVYRTLALLEEIGAVRHVHLSHGPALYEGATSTGVRHLVCEVCERHVAVPSERVRRRPPATRATTSTSCSTVRTSRSSAAAAAASSPDSAPISPDPLVRGIPARGTPMQQNTRMRGD